MAGRRRWSEDERRAVLAEHEHSGRSLWAFARAAEIPYTTLVHCKSPLHPIWRHRVATVSVT